MLTTVCSNSLDYKSPQLHISDLQFCSAVSMPHFLQKVTPPPPRILPSAFALLGVQLFKAWACERVWCWNLLGSSQMLLWLLPGDGFHFMMSFQTHEVGQRYILFSTQNYFSKSRNQGENFGQVGPQEIGGGSPPLIRFTRLNNKIPCTCEVFELAWQPSVTT